MPDTACCVGQLNSEDIKPDVLEVDNVGSVDETSDTMALDDGVLIPVVVTVDIADIRLVIALHDILDVDTFPVL